MKDRIYNFAAGPAAMPEAVLRRAAEEMMNYRKSGQSVMEMSHRSAVFQGILNETEKLLRELMQIPENYKVLFLQGGGSTQFSMIPLNFRKRGKADYIITGQWAKKAAEEAGKFLTVTEAASGLENGFRSVPDLSGLHFSDDADYLYLCQNNTIYGTHYTAEQIPDTGKIPLVADISSCILGEPIEVERYGLLFAGAQKNLGPAGVTIVIIREDLLSEPEIEVPTMLTYKIHADHGSMYNTPPCYSIYMVKLVLEWLKEEIGGTERMFAYNREKAAKLYEYLDNSSLFKGRAEKESRSLMNVVFSTGDTDLDAKFVKEAADAGLVNLKGHRAIGGIRASLYNAVSMEAVEALIQFMKQFEDRGMER